MLYNRTYIPNSKTIRNIKTLYISIIKFQYYFDVPLSNNNHQNLNAGMQLIDKDERHHQHHLTKRFNQKKKKNNKRN